MSDAINICVSLRIFGHDVKTEQITGLIGVNPTSQSEHDKNQPKSHKNNGSWLLSSDWSDLGLDEQIQNLLSPLTKDLKNWKEITSKYKVDIFCGFQFNDAQAGFSLEPETISLLSQRGLLVNFDLYFVGNEMSQDDSVD